MTPNPHRRPRCPWRPATGDGGAGLPGADTTITAKEYAFEVGELKAGANEVRFQNDGKEIHMLVAAPIAPGKTIDDVRTALAAEGEPEAHRLSTSIRQWTRRCSTPGNHWSRR